MLSILSRFVAACRLDAELVMRSTKEQKDCRKVVKLSMLEVKFSFYSNSESKNSILRRSLLVCKISVIFLLVNFTEQQSVCN